MLLKDFNETSRVLSRVSSRDGMSSLSLEVSIFESCELICGKVLFPD